MVFQDRLSLHRCKEFGNGNPHEFNDFLLIRSSNEGKTWENPVLVKRARELIFQEEMDVSF